MTGQPARAGLGVPQENSPAPVQPSMTQKLAIGPGVVFIALSKAIAFGTTVVLSRTLGVSAFGAYGAILLTLSLFGIAAQASLGSAASVLISRALGEGPARASQVISAIVQLFLATSAVTALTLYVASPQIARVAFADARLADGLRLSAGTLILVAGASLLDGILAAFKAFMIRNALPFVQAGTLLTFSMVLAPRFGLTGALWAYALSNLVPVIIGTVLVCRRARFNGVRLRLVCGIAQFTDVLRFSGPMCLNAFLVVGTNWLVTSAVARSTYGLSGVGLFTIATQLRMLIVVLPYLVHSTYSPLLSSGYARGDGAARETYLSAFRLTVFFGSGIAIALSFSAAPLLQIFGKSFVNGHSTLSLSCALGLAMAIANLLGTNLVAQGKTRATILPNVVLALCSIALAEVTARSFGAAGVVGALVTAQLCQLMLLLNANRRYVHQRLGGRLSIGLVLLVAATAFITPFSSAIGLLLSAGLSLTALVLTLANAPKQVYERLPCRLGSARLGALRLD